ncbi:MAG: hypothetical protein NTU69_00730 [Proteobacteria bacterium]|jgi:hypothetical protein|nr:hypothetical protein [Pseudomonadota bacterium]
MNVLKYIEALRRNMKTLNIVLIVYLAVLALYDVALRLTEAHGHYWIDTFPAYWTIFGGVGCFILIKVAKGIAHLFLSKDEDYYG